MSHPWLLSYSSHSIHGQIPVAILFNLSQVWQPSVPPPQARPPLHLIWTTGSISYMIAPSPHLALPQLILCSTTRQITFKCHDISLLLCLNISHRTQNKIQSPPMPTRPLWCGLCTSHPHPHILLCQRTPATLSFLPLPKSTKHSPWSKPW